MSLIYNIHNIFYVKSDINLKLDYFKENEPPDHFDLIIKSVRYRDIERKKSQKISSGLYYSKEHQSIFSDLNVFRIPVYWEIKNILGDCTELIVSKSYDIFSKYILLFQVASVHRIESLFRMILQIKLLMKKGTFLVGSATSFKERGIIFTGTHGCGKTMTVLNFIERYGSRFLADDHMIFFDNKLFCYPTLMKIRKFNLDFVSISSYLNPLEIFDKKIERSLKADPYIFFLEASSDVCVSDMTLDEGIQKLSNINNKAIQYFSERLFSSMPYCFKELSILNLQQKQLDSLNIFFKNAHFYTLSAKDVSGYMMLVQKYFEDIFISR